MSGFTDVLPVPRRGFEELPIDTVNIYWLVMKHFNYIILSRFLNTGMSTYIASTCDTANIVGFGLY